CPPCPGRYVPSGQHVRLAVLQATPWPVTPRLGHPTDDRHSLAMAQSSCCFTAARHRSSGIPRPSSKEHHMEERTSRRPTADRRLLPSRLAPAAAVVASLLFSSLPMAGVTAAVGHPGNGASHPAVAGARLHVTASSALAGPVILMSVKLTNANIATITQ
ncbi:MAG: hypothetical protein ABJB47_17745, partial [Actinomycetota bacterium]